MYIHLVEEYRFTCVSIVSEWVSDCCLTLNEQSFSYIMVKTCYIKWMPTLYLTNTLSSILIVLAHWNNSLWVDMSLHTDTLSCFRTNQYLLSLLNVECLAEKQQLPILIVFDLSRLGLQSKTYHTRGQHANHYTTDAVCDSIDFKTKQS